MSVWDYQANWAELIEQFWFFTFSHKVSSHFCTCFLRWKLYHFHRVIICRHQNFPLDTLRHSSILWTSHHEFHSQIHVTSVRSARRQLLRSAYTRHDKCCWTRYIKEQMYQRPSNFQFRATTFREELIVAHEILLKRSVRSNSTTFYVLNLPC